MVPCLGLTTARGLEAILGLSCPIVAPISRPALGLPTGPDLDAGYIPSSSACRTLGLVPPPPPPPPEGAQNGLPGDPTDGEEPGTAPEPAPQGAFGDPVARSAPAATLGLVGTGAMTRGPGAWPRPLVLLPARARPERLAGLMTNRDRTAGTSTSRLVDTGRPRGDALPPPSPARGLFADFGWMVAVTSAAAAAAAATAATRCLEDTAKATMPTARMEGLAFMNIGMGPKPDAPTVDLGEVRPTEGD